MSKNLTAPTTLTMPVGDLIAKALADMGVTTMFGVISIHNMPILDAVFRQGRIRFVPARGEAGAMNMADAYARVSRSLGVVITSTGTAAGNAAGSQVEALTAGSPVLHITTTVDTDLMDRDRAAIHDVPRQPDMLKAISKKYFRLWDARATVPMLEAAISAALSAPTGPVSLEIPVDVQRHDARVPLRIVPPVLTHVAPDATLLDEIASLVKSARRPMLYLGGGARNASVQAKGLLDRGFLAVTSTNGRAVVPESDPRNLGAFNMTHEAQDIFDACDLMIVVGSRLRGNETRNNALRLGRPLIQIDAEPSQGGRNYEVDLFLQSEAHLALQGLLDRLPTKLNTDDGFAKTLIAARQKGEADLVATLGPYAKIADALRARVAKGLHPFVRDVTISNSTYGNRYVDLAAPHLGVHALGGGIGQGVAMSIGASVASKTKTIALAGDGGVQLNLGEFTTAVDEQAEIVFILMNDQAYGVISNIQDAQYGSRHAYCRLRTPDFGLLSQAIGLSHIKLTSLDGFEAELDRAIATPGPHMIEIDMLSIGPFAQSFGGPPAGAAGGAK